jgi:integrase
VERILACADAYVSMDANIKPFTGVRAIEADCPGQVPAVWDRDKFDATSDDTWTQRYGQRHQMRRVTDWPVGIVPPRRVRVYFRNGWWLLQWWEPSARKNQAERIDGDLVAAISRAREIEQRLISFKKSGRLPGRVRHRELVERFLTDLAGRADAGQIQPRSVARYRSALSHYVAFADLDLSSHKFPFVLGVNRDFAMQFAVFLKNRSVAPNGSDSTAIRPMVGTAFVWDAVRAMFEWAVDPDRGDLLPSEFRSPFRRSAIVHRPVRDPFGEPDITLGMCKALLEACDDYQLRLLAPMVFYGLRAAEPAFIFGEYLEPQWLRVPCATEIDYLTKGRRDKRLPLFEPLTSILGPARPGLLYLRRTVALGTEKPELRGASLAELAAVMQHRFNDAGQITATQRQAIRNRVLAEAGATSYDGIEGEFGTLARRLAWPRAATLKDLRHSFATTLAAVGMPEVYRQYLMGHSPSSAAINAYTHLNQINEWYRKALEGPWAELLTILKDRRQPTNA